MKTCTMKESKDLCLTVYNDGFGLVSERRGACLEETDTRLQYMDVAQRIEVESLRAEGIDVAEVNYEYDLVDKSKLLGKYVGDIVFLKNKDDVNNKQCRLLSAGPGLILEDTRTGEVLIDPEGQLILPKFPDGLSARPALVFQLRPRKSEEIQVSYLTKGLSWVAHYVTEIKEKTLGIDAWVEIRNEAGITFTDTRLKLLAGEVNRVQGQQYDMPYEASIVRETAVEVGFEEKSFSDYHLYTMQGVTTLKDNQSKQVNLFGADSVPYRRFYEVAPFCEDARIAIEFDNKSETGLGIPFPAGAFKVYQKDDADGGLTFVGEDEMGHTPKDEKIRLYIGEAFDLRCERKCLNKRTELGIRKERWQINLKNHKDEAALMRVLHSVPGAAEIAEATHSYERRNANELLFEVELNSDARISIEFIVVINEQVHVIHHK